MRILSKDPAKRPQTADAMSIELARARESALSVTSGIRASLSGAIEAKHDVVAVSPANDTLDAPHAPEPPRGRSRGRGLLAVGLVVALAGAGAFLMKRAQERPLLAPVIPATPSEPPPPPALPPPRAPLPSAIAHSEPTATPVATNASAAAHESRAPAPAPHIAAAPSPEPRPVASARRHGPLPKPAGAGPAAGPAGSVGYGYLE